MGRFRGKRLNLDRTDDDVQWPCVPWTCPECSGVIVNQLEIVATLATEDPKDDTFLCIQCDYKLLPEAPKPTGRSGAIDIRGMLFMWAAGQPVLVRSVGDPYWYLPVFSSKDRLVIAAREFGLDYDRIKQIQDHGEFLASIWETDPNVRVVVDPHNRQGKVRYTLVKGPEMN